MPGTETPTIPLSEKLSTVTHHHLITHLPVKLDLDDWNYGTWEFFFKQLCFTHEVPNYIRGTNTTTSAPLSPEEQKVYIGSLQPYLTPSKHGWQSHDLKPLKKHVTS